jgi:hypothetical protein
MGGWGRRDGECQRRSCRCRKGKISVRIGMFKWAEWRCLTMLLYCSLELRGNTTRTEANQVDSCMGHCRSLGATLICSPLAMPCSLVCDSQQYLRWYGRVVGFQHVVRYGLEVWLNGDLYISLFDSSGSSLLCLNIALKDGNDLSSWAGWWAPRWHCTVRRPIWRRPYVMPLFDL